VGRSLAYLPTYGSTVLFVGPWLIFQILNLYIVGRTAWMEDQPIARPLPTHKTTQTPNKRAQTSWFQSDSANLYKAVIKFLICCVSKGQYKSLLRYYCLCRRVKIFLNTRSRNNVVGMATGHRLDGRGVGVRVPVGSRIFSMSSRPAVGPTQHPIQWVSGVGLFLRR
jgi:hypothetical protein